MTTITRDIWVSKKLDKWRFRIRYARQIRQVDYSPNTRSRMHNWSNLAGRRGKGEKSWYGEIRRDADKDEFGWENVREIGIFRRLSRVGFATSILGFWKWIEMISCIRYGCFPCHARWGLAGLALTFVRFLMTDLIVLRQSADTVIFLEFRTCSRFPRLVLDSTTTLMILKFWTAFVGKGRGADISPL